MGHEITDPDALEIFHPVAEFVEHIADLAFVALRQDDADTSNTERLDALGHGQTILQADTAGEAFDVVVVEILIQGDVVFFLNLVFGMGKAFGKLAGITEQNEAVAVQVEPANMGQVVKRGRQQIVDRIAALWVSTRAEKALGFVEQQGGFACLLEHDAIVADGVVGEDTGAHIFANFAVDLDLPSGDEVLTAASRAETAGGEKAVQADAFTGCR